MSLPRTALLTSLVYASLFSTAHAALDLRIDTYRSPEDGTLVEEVYSIEYLGPGEEDEPTNEVTRLNSFFLELTFDQPNEGLTFGPPSLPARSPFVFPGVGLVDEGSTPQVIRVSAALPDPDDFVELTGEPAFLRFQIRVPPDYEREGFGVGLNALTTRLTGPGGEEIAFDPVGRSYSTIDYVPEPAAGLLALAAAGGLLRRRRSRRME